MADRLLKDRGWRRVRLPDGELEVREGGGLTVAAISAEGRYWTWAPPGRPTRDAPSWTGRGKNQRDAERLVLVILGES